ncbi:MAG: hypothetical protein ABI629_00115 [bacterium]
MSIESMSTRSDHCARACGWRRDAIGRAVSAAGSIVAAALALAACGGGAGSSGGGLAFRAVWERAAIIAEQPVGCGMPRPTAGPGGFGAEIPAAVSLIQIQIEAANGRACCVRLEKRADRRRVSFVDVPAGQAQVTISGFAGLEYAPRLALPECRLDPAADNPVSSPCTGGSPDISPNPSFQSAPTCVDIPSAGTRDAGNISIFARPFVLLGDCDGPQLVPPPRGTASATIAFTVADAGGAIRPDSIRAAVLQGSQTVEVALGAPTSCDDGADPKCSCGAEPLQVTGVRNLGRILDRSLLQPGPARLQISATDLGGQTTEFTYGFTYAIPTVTETPTPTATPSLTPIPTEPPTPTPPIVLRIIGDRVVPGEVASLNVSLEVPRGVSVAALEQQIGFVATVVRLSGCVREPAIRDHRFFWGLDPPGCEFGCDILHTTILPVDGSPLPSTVLYTCGFSVDDEAAAGTYPLTCLSAAATDSENQRLPLVCIPGQVEVPSP